MVRIDGHVVSQDVALKQPYNIDGFLHALQIVCKTTPDHDKGLRDCYLSVIADNRAKMQESEAFIYFLKSGAENSDRAAESRDSVRHHLDVNYTRCKYESLKLVTPVSGMALVKQQPGPPNPGGQIPLHRLITRIKKM
jgi:hypothetical protein